MKTFDNYFHDMWHVKDLSGFHEVFSTLMNIVKVKQYGFYLLQDGVNFKNTYLISGKYDADQICHKLDENFNFNLKLQIRKHLVKNPEPSYIPALLPLKTSEDHKSTVAWKSIVINYSNTRILGMKWGIFALSDVPGDELKDSIQIRMGEFAYATSQLRNFLESHLRRKNTAPTPKLTFRQMQVLKKTVTCSYRKEVAAQLGISVVTVAKHLDKIAELLEVENRREIIDAAMRCGILPIYDQFDN
jgi:DNA-binding CsgD family transcriptional regulator